MKIGVTGTRTGMTIQQRTVFTGIMKELGATVLIDGCCLGVDEEAYLIAKDMGITTIGKPGFSAKNPLDMSFRSMYQRDVMHPAKSHFARNRDIVQESDIMIAIPYELGTSGGTNYTIQFAQNWGRPMYVILRNGDIIGYNLKQ